MSLIYIYNCFSNEKVVPSDLDKAELLIPPMIVNNLSWVRGYFETIDNMSISEKEKKIEFGFWDILTQKYRDIHGRELKKKPKYCSIYGLGSYGVVGKEVQKVIRAVH